MMVRASRSRAAAPCLAHDVALGDDAGDAALGIDHHHRADAVPGQGIDDGLDAVAGLHGHDRGALLPEDMSNCHRGSLLPAGERQEG